jgi:hypothetical protein
MRITANQQQELSPDEALIALAQAYRQIDPLTESVTPANEGSANLPEKAKQPTPDNQLPPATPARRPFQSLVLLSLIGAPLLACIGAAYFGWQTFYGRQDPEPISTSSLKDSSAGPVLPIKDTPSKTGVALLPERSIAAQPSVLTTSPVPSTSALEKSVQNMAGQLEDLEREIEQLKASQSQIARDNAELTKNLQSAREMERRNAGLIEDLKEAHAQLTRDNASLTEKLATNQEQMNNIKMQLKTSQEQVARLLERKRPVPSATPKPALAPPPSQIRAHTQNTPRLQP